VRKPEGKRPLGRLSVDGRIIFKMAKEKVKVHPRTGHESPEGE
jgi:hypothetical protein